MKNKLLEAFFLITLVFFIGYAFGMSYIAIIISIVMSLISFWLSERVVSSELKAKMLTHIAVGTSFGFSWGIYASYVSTVASVSIAAFFIALSGRLERENEEIDLKGIILAGLALGITYGFSISGLALYFSGFIYSMQIFGGIIVFTFILTAIGILIGKFLKPRLELYKQFFPYLSVMKDAAIAFAVGYLFIGILFALFYACDWRFNNGNTLKLPDNQSTATFFDFVYFSFITIATVGYGDALPISTVSRTLVIIEVIIGIGWITIVFAAVTAYLQKPFAEIILQHKSNKSLGI